MNKLLTTIIFFVFMVSFSWGDDELCQIVDINGAVVYTGVCRYSGRDINTNGKISLNGVYVLKSMRSRASHLIRVNDNEIKNIKTIGSDSLSIMKNRSVNANFTSKVLKKESLISDEFYLRTNFYAINGIGYEDRSSADDNFATLFAYVENELSQKFPEDTITTELVFNKTSQDIYTDFIQSVYLKAKELKIDNAVVNLGYTIFLSSASFIAEVLSLDNEYAQKLIELEKYKDELWVNVVVSNTETELALISALSNSVQNKSRAIVLGHSQGGMYTYKAFNSFPDSIQEHFYSLNVAVPTDKNPNWYLVNDNDKIINKLRIPFVNNIPDGESNSSIDGSDYGGESGHYHAWLDSYYNPKLKSYAKINNAIINAFRTVPYWKKEKATAEYQLVWYNGAAETTIEIAKTDGSFEKLGTYHGYNVTDSTIKKVSNILLQDGVPLLRVESYLHDSWWGPYLSTDSRFFSIISNSDGTLTYLMSDAYSPNSFDDAEFQITLSVE